MQPALTTLERHIDGHRAAVEAFLRRRVGPEDGEELAQEVWLRVARSGQHFADEAGFRAFAFTVARRLLIDHHRRRGARIAWVSDDGAPEAAAAHGPQHALEAERTLAVVEAALRAMKPEISEVWRWRTTDDLSFHQIAARQGCTLNTALGRMHQATRSLRRALFAAGCLDEEG